MLLRALAPLLLATLLGGCYRDNLPVETAFVAPAYIPPKARVFVDMAGSFFPNGWRDYVDPEKKWASHSLLIDAWARAHPRKGAPDTKLGELLRNEEDRQLHQLADYLKDKTRVFILIHGFNDSEHEATAAFDILERRIAFKNSDALIEFYWDGYVADGGLGQVSAAGFWFTAVTNSKLAGEYGLRKILALLDGSQRAILIAHSRGASVVLSALANAPFTPAFVEKTRRTPALAGRPLDPPALATKAAQIDAILLAPAIGRIDFCDGVQREACPHLIKLPPQLAKLIYTTNKHDQVLDKYLGLSHAFNATDLGLKPDVGARIIADGGYGFMHRQEIDPGHKHDFRCYASDVEVTDMLKAIDVDVRESGLPRTDQRPVCGVKHQGVE